MLSEEHRRAQELAIAAEALERDGRARDARAMFADAAALELRAVDLVPHAKARTWGILAVSAASLLYKAKALDDAENQIYRFLACEWILPDTRQGLKRVLELVWDEQSLPAGYSYWGDQFMVTMREGQIGPGTAPLDVVIDSTRGLRGLTWRAVQFTHKRPFTRSAEDDPFAAVAIHTRATQPAAGSYRFFIRFVAPAQAELFPDLPHVEAKEIADTLFSFIRLATESAPGATEALKRLVPHDEYRNAMLKLVRNVVPTGRAVGELELTRMVEMPGGQEPLRETVRLTKAARVPINEVIKATSEVPLGEADEALSGTLRAVDLDHSWLEVVKRDGAREHCEIAKATFDDVVGPLVNKRVIVTGTRKGTSRKFYVSDIEPDPDSDPK